MVTPMKPFKINAEWDNEAHLWVATSDDIDGLAIEASTVDALIERLKIVIPELIAADHVEMPSDELPVMLDGFIASRKSNLNHTH
jgi:predicted RNase H-like HicB family nuclease